MQSVMTAGAGHDTAGDLLVEYGVWLDRQRGLAPVTVKNYCANVQSFVASLPSPVGVSIAGLDARVVTEFMTDFCRGRNTNSAKSMARSMRSFLRFAHATGRTRTELSGAVPSSAGWRLAALPKAVPATDIQRLVGVAMRGARLSPTGQRDYAVLLLLTRLGLRRGEVAALGLDDIDWRAGELTIVGKGDCLERLPLPADAGEAIVAWLRGGRPATSPTRSVFTTVRPVGRPLTGSAVGHIVHGIADRAGVAPIGAHQLRHTLATEMLRAGATLMEVGQVLRHRSVRSTAIYAKVDEIALRPLARPWPGTTPAVSDAVDADRFLVRPWPAGAR